MLLGAENEAPRSTGLAATVPGTSSDVLHIVNAGLSGTAIKAVAVHAGGIGLRAEGSHGVTGTSYDTTGVGVLGEDATGQSLGRGVQGVATNGWGVFAVSANGQALRVDGRATFSRSGLTTIAYPESTATVTVPGVSSSGTNFPERPTFALATVQSDSPGVYVRAAVLDAAAGQLTIFLNAPPGRKARPESVIVGWFVVN